MNFLYVVELSPWCDSILGYVINMPTEVNQRQHGIRKMYWQTYQSMSTRSKWIRESPFIQPLKYIHVQNIWFYLTLPYIRSDRSKQCKRIGFVHTKSLCDWHSNKLEKSHKKHISKPAILSIFNSKYYARRFILCSIKPRLVFEHIALQTNVL